MAQNEVYTDNSAVIAQLQEENEELKDRLDVLHMTYLSQISLWKSNYESTEKINNKHLSFIDKQCKLIDKMSSLLMHILAMRYNSEQLQKAIDKVWEFYQESKNNINVTKED